MTHDEVKNQQALLERVETGTFTIRAPDDLKPLWRMIALEWISVYTRRGYVCVRITKAGLRAIEKARTL
jgi:hypothetical protein